jgi:subtilisin-like proprotein convertase family protein/uncharacterized protein YvpB
MKLNTPYYTIRFLSVTFLITLLLLLGQLTGRDSTSAHGLLQATQLDATGQLTPQDSTTPDIGEPQATITSTPVVSSTQTITVTASITNTVSVDPIPTVTPTIYYTPTVSAAFEITLPLEPMTTTLNYLPFVLQRPAPTYIPPSRVIFCNSSSASIPDNNASGVDRTITITDPRTIMDLDITLDINHTWVGDLRLKLTHHETDRTITLVDRPGYPASEYGCSYDNIKAILDDEISSSVANKCASSPAAISGIFIPETPLSIFDGQPITGNWTLNISDRSVNDTGRFNQWCLVSSISPAPEPPTPTPVPPSLPSQAIISNVTGKAQALPLDCESRSAVDWANYFGRRINEIEFFNNLPESDNPDVGFVGDVYGQWGQIPPNDYGVHAEPVAALLRQYGLQAYAHRPLSWNELRAEIAAGRPVIVWIIGSITNGIPVYYTPGDGLSTIVARYEHTVVVTGYTQNLVYYLNGGTIYSRSVSQFLDSWSALGNMAVTARP